MGELFVVIIPDIVVLVAVYTIVVSVKFYNTIYYKIYMKKYRKDYSPYISVFIPCKGIDEHFEDNIQSFLQHRYLKGTVIKGLKNYFPGFYPIKPFFLAGCLKYSVWVSL